MAKKKYNSLEEHPKWNELEQICNKIVSLKIKAKQLRSEIEKEVK